MSAGPWVVETGEHPTDGVTDVVHSDLGIRLTVNWYTLPMTGGEPRDRAAWVELERKWAHRIADRLNKTEEDER